jgi:hypothetical protein
MAAEAVLVGTAPPGDDGARNAQNVSPELNSCCPTEPFVVESILERQTQNLDPHGHSTPTPLSENYSWSC